MGKKPKLPGGDETILLVDDNEAVWDVLIESLQNLGYSVILAEDGIDTVEIYRNNPDQIDLVILDMIMPKQGGHSTFFELKSIDPEVNVLLISGYVSESEVKDLLQQGAKGFLPKPCRIDVLAKELRRILDDRKGGKVGNRF
jgi:DNA-binding NtrC family response regulator